MSVPTGATSNTGWRHSRSNDQHDFGKCPVVDLTTIWNCKSQDIRIIHRPIYSNMIIHDGLLFTHTGTAAISAPTITSITPTNAVNNGWQTIDIVGTGFSGSTVTLTKTGQSTVTGATTATADTATTLDRNFNLNGIAAGTWNVVILNTDGGTVTGTFTVNSATASTVTAISPTSGTVNTTVSTTITGNRFCPAHLQKSACTGVAIILAVQ